MPSVFKPLICQINLYFLNLGKLRAPDPALNSFNTTWFIPFACKKLRESKDYSTVSNSRSETGSKPDRKSRTCPDQLLSERNFPIRYSVQIWLISTINIDSCCNQERKNIFWKYILIIYIYQFFYIFISHNELENIKVT